VLYKNNIDIILHAHVKGVKGVVMDFLIKEESYKTELNNITWMNKN
jgi:hypothetical protein